MRRIWDVSRSVCCILLAAATLTATAAAQAPQLNNTEKKSWNPFKKDSSKPQAAATPAGDPNDPTSLSNKKKPDATFYASWGELEERGGRNAKALELYQRALKEDRRNLPALLGAARMQDASNAHEEALNYYRQALRAHPNEAPVYNDLGLSYSRAGQYPQAVQAFQRAVQIDGQRKLYRNNLANVMIDAGQVDQALFQLQQAHGEALGHFNLGYLLAQKQRNSEASECFARARELDPALDVGADWQERLAMRDRPTSRAVEAPHAAPVEMTSPVAAEPQFAPEPEQVAQEAAGDSQPVFGAPVIVETTPEPFVQSEAPAESPLLDFGQPGPIETVESSPVAESVAPEAPLSEPILPESEVSPAPAEVVTGPGTVYESPKFAEQDTSEGEPLAPVVRAAPSMEPMPIDSAATAPNGQPIASGRFDGRPAIPPRPSAVQLYRQHAAHSDQAPTPDGMFPAYDPSQTVDTYPAPAPGESVHGSHAPHVGRRPATNHQAPPKRSARTFKNPFSGMFGTPKKR